MTPACHIDISTEMSIWHKVPVWSGCILQHLRQHRHRQHNKSPRKSRGFETRTNDRTIAWTISKNSRLEERKTSTQLIIDNCTILCNLQWEFKYVRQMKKRFKRQQKKRHFSWSKSRNVMNFHCQIQSKKKRVTEKCKFFHSICVMQKEFKFNLLLFLLLFAFRIFALGSFVSMQSHNDWMTNWWMDGWTNWWLMLQVIFWDAVEGAAAAADAAFQFNSAIEWCMWWHNVICILIDSFGGKNKYSK